MTSTSALRSVAVSRRSARRVGDSFRKLFIPYEQEERIAALAVETNLTADINKIINFAERPCKGGMRMQRLLAARLKELLSTETERSE